MQTQTAYAVAVPQDTVSSPTMSNITSTGASFSSSTINIVCNTSNCGVEYSTSSTLATYTTVYATTATQVYNSNYDFSGSISGLAPNTTYYVRAFATTYTSSIVSFTTTSSGGSLSVTAPTIVTGFPSDTLNGTTQHIYATLSSWSCADTTGSGAGWHISLIASIITEVTPSGGYATGTSALSFPSGSLTLAGTRTITAQSGAQAISSTDGPLLENQTAAIDVGTPVVIIDTQAGYGSGAYTIGEPTSGLELNIPVTTIIVDKTNYAGQPTPYQTTLTYTITSGP